MPNRILILYFFRLRSRQAGEFEALSAPNPRMQADASFER
jgi:hypothetical protein